MRENLTLTFTRNLFG